MTKDGCKKGEEKVKGKCYRIVPSPNILKYQVIDVWGGQRLHAQCFGGSKTIEGAIKIAATSKDKSRMPKSLRRNAAVYEFKGYVFDREGN